jgi:subtilisin family serine protease
VTTTLVTGTRPARYQPGQLVVALEHCDNVIEILTRARARPVRLDQSASLGLALLSVGGDIELVTSRLVAGAGSAAAGVPAPTSKGDLAPLLAGLRSWFGGQHSGWYPAMGKNRLVGSVTGGDGIVSHGGSGMPRVLSQPLPRRADGPGEGVVVGVLDTGIANHPWLAGGWTAHGSDRLTERPPYRPEEGHATFVAGLILSQAPTATLRVRKVLSRPAVADCWSVATSIAEFAHAGVDVLNLSFVCYTEDGAPPLALSRAVERLGPDVVVVAAAGNHGALLDAGEARRPAFPAALEDVVAVGAVDRDRIVAAYTPRDAEWVDLLAVGTDVPSTYLSGLVSVGSERQEFAGWATWSGTSFAAALVSGAIAAGTVPGHVSARESYEVLRAAAVPARARDGRPGRRELVLLTGPFATP